MKKSKRIVFILAGLLIFLVLGYFLFTGCHLSEVPEIEGQA